MELGILIAGYVLGFYMAWNIGANDVANAMAPAVGSRAITIRQAVLIAGILNLIGATFIGGHVTDTIRKGIVTTEVLRDPHAALIGALSTLLAASLWISFATWKSLPVSTTHSIVGALIGFGIMAQGVSVIRWGKLGAVVVSWIVSPLFSMIIAFLVFKMIVVTILAARDPVARTVRLAPYFLGVTVFVVVLSFLFKTPLGQRLALGSFSATIVSLAAMAMTILGSRPLFARLVAPGRGDGVESVFRKIQIGTACYVALAQGANDVANAVGPLVMITSLAKTGQVGESLPVPITLLLFGGVGISAGIFMWGYRVMDTLGTKITSLTNTRGFSVNFATATTVMICSKMGLPVSTTHAAVGGVLGVGLAHGIEAVNLGIIYRIILYWVLTVPASAVTCMVLFKILQFCL